MADKAGAGGKAAAIAELASERLKLFQTGYANADHVAPGFGSDETAAALRREPTRWVSKADNDIAERLVADFGLWVGNLRARRVAVVGSGRRRRSSSANGAFGRPIPETGGRPSVCWA